MKIYDPRKILVPIDFSEYSEGVIEAGVDIARDRGATVTVLHVARESDYLAHYGGEFHASNISSSKLRDDAWHLLESRLKALVNKAAQGACVEEILIWGSPVRDILSVAEHGGHDLIVMATEGRRMLSRFFLGSVTEEVIRRAPCPVLAIRAKVAEKILAPQKFEEAVAN
ncbi:MAG: universal stress protein [Nitrospinaceae bacterium]|jgi:nucleotide-binding universal stress UspA family protein|nr:universal stress protein [Nitrospinaceae bacterium]MBT3432445.1 universal stress protein [Nitrospinaceae bacterium]MBT3823111.1 universal stress protein [Nitrospinaceae bacterium]MBT4093247.1 universal stress protein [Nitrospinaceae bacterium]MBT4431173.1 universal stress protein [Nitrospinaceae bacterium]